MKRLLFLLAFLVLIVGKAMSQGMSYAQQTMMTCRTVNTQLQQPESTVEVTDTVNTDTGLVLCPTEISGYVVLGAFRFWLGLSLLVISLILLLVFTPIYRDDSDGVSWWFGSIGLLLFASAMIILFV